MANKSPRSYLVAYDITDEKRLARVHKLMTGWGAPLQYSVFRCELSPSDKKQLISQLYHQMDNKADDIRIYALTMGAPILWLGQQPLPEGVMLLE